MKFLADNLLRFPMPRLTFLLMLSLGGIFAAADPTAAPPQLVSSNLWDAGAGGYATYRIPGIVVTKKGSVLAYAEARKTLDSDVTGIDIVLRRSTDGGKTFSTSQRIAGKGEITTGNPTAIADLVTGDVVMLFQTDYAECYVIRSHDDGATFSQPEKITGVFKDLKPRHPWEMIAPGPTHGVQLRNGRLVAAVWLAPPVLKANGKVGHGPSFVTTVYSDDHGATWKHGDVIAVSDPSITSLNETAIAQLGDGSVVLNSRSSSAHYRRVLAFSPDGATRWTAAAYEEQLFDPISDAGLAHGSIPGAGNILVFSNPTSTAKPTRGIRYSRATMTVRVSTDDGKTWSYSRVLNPGMAGYSDLAITPDGRILCLYESGTANGKDTNAAHLTLASFTLSWVKGN